MRRDTRHPLTSVRWGPRSTRRRFSERRWWEFSERLYARTACCSNYELEERSLSFWPHRVKKREVKSLCEPSTHAAQLAGQVIAHPPSSSILRSRTAT